MDSAIIRRYVKRKKKTFALTIILLLILTFEFYYLNCYNIYVPFFCELTFVYVILIFIVANVWFYFSGGDKAETGSMRSNK